MIIGIGCDILSVARVERALNRFGKRFLERVFTQYERTYRASLTAAYYAARFAAKEAFMKAIGLGLAQGLSWQDITVVKLQNGQPGIRVNGVAAQRLEALSTYGQPHVHVTLSHERDYATAFVVVEAR